MKVFEKGSKVNFVDENNLLLGWDNTDDCCAKGGWFLSDKLDDWAEKGFKEEAMELPGFVFDKEYVREWSENEDNKDDDGGRPLQFRLVNGDQEKFLTIYNHHNGYYSRGFEFMDGDKQIKEGSI